MKLIEVFRGGRPCRCRRSDVGRVVFMGSCAESCTESLKCGSWVFEIHNQRSCDFDAMRPLMPDRMRGPVGGGVREENVAVTERGVMAEAMARASTRIVAVSMAATRMRVHRCAVNNACSAGRVLLGGLRGLFRASAFGLMGVGDAGIRSLLLKVARRSFVECTAILPPEGAGGTWD